jgi:hypothetical protein
MRFLPSAAVAALAFSLTGGSPAQHVHDEHGQLGKVAFANSCDAKVQPELQRAMADAALVLVHAGEKTFRNVLQNDPRCRIATFGVARLLMNNPLAGQGASPQAAASAQAAIDQGRRIEGGTQRERDYVEAVAAYYADFASKPERARQAARAASVRGTRRALSRTTTRRRSSRRSIPPRRQSQADQTYAAYLKAAAVLEKQFVKYPDHPGVAHYLIHSYDARRSRQRG